MDTIPHLSLDCEQNEDGAVSLAERRSSFVHDCSTSDSSVIHITDRNPSSNWELPPIVPSEVYDLKWWKYKSSTQVKLSSIDVCFADNEEPVHINLLEKHQIDWAIKQGYKYAHLGAIRLGLGNFKVQVHNKKY